MNVAAITITYNDDYKFTEWLGHYQEYKDELYLHIVVDNHSCEEYASKLRTFFPCSKIIRRSSNGGCTYAYNDGIKVALADKNVDAILLIGNDIRLPAGELTKLYHFLYRDEGLGMVAPVVLKKDSEVIESVGCFISRYLFLKEPYVDNLLFMYSDEVDMGLRAKKLGVNLAVTTEAKAWHQHLNAGGGKHRMFYTSYLMGRNKVYLAKKHFGFWRSAEQLAFHSFLFFKGVVGNVFHKEKLMHQLYFIRGSWNGFTGDMELGKIIKDFKPDEDNKGL